MNMINDTTIAILPVGEFDTDIVKKEFDSILRAFDPSITNLIVADPVSDEQGARKSVNELSARNPDLFLIVPLRGLSAKVIETILRTSHAPSVISPLKGRFALPSSALAIGAAQDSKDKVEMLYAPPDSPDFIERLRVVTIVAGDLSKMRQSTGRAHAGNLLFDSCHKAKT